MERENDPEDDRQRGADRHGAGHHHQELHLLDVVGDPGDERRRAEAADLPGREAGHRMEQAPRDVAAEAHGDLRAQVNGDGREDDLDEREGQHQAAGRRM